MGLIYFHSGPETLAFVERAYRMVQESGDDQVAFNGALASSKVRYPRG